MSKFLKLVGLNTYTSAAIDNTIVAKGQFIRVSDAMAERLGNKGRFNAENEFTPYFKEVDSAGAKPIYDCGEVAESEQTFYDPEQETVQTEAKVVKATKPATQRRKSATPKSATPPAAV